MGIRKISHTNKGSFTVCLPKGLMEGINAQYVKIEWLPGGKLLVSPILLGDENYGSSRIFWGCAAVCGIDNCNACD